MGFTMDERMARDKKTERVLEDALEKKYKDTPYVMVWYCKTVQNRKGIYYLPVKKLFVEATLNGDEKEVYLDAYARIDKTIIKLEEEK